jgi:hypothetical protein
MKKIKIIFIFVLITSCSTVNDVGKVMRNEKTTTTDEFLVKKKEPLVLPPDYNELPKPDTLKNKQISEDDQIKKILKSSPSSKKKINKGTTSIEKKIIDRIKSE